MFDLLSVLYPAMLLLGCVVDLSKPRIDLKQLARQEGVHSSAAWRWALRGVCGIKLPTRCIGAKRVTTAEAFASWSDQVTAIRNGQTPSPRTSSQRRSAVEAAEKKLEAMGV